MTNIFNMIQKKNEKDEDEKMKTIQEETKKRIELINARAARLVELLEREDSSVEDATMSLQSALRMIQSRGNKKFQPVVDELNKSKLVSLPPVEEPKT